MRAGKKIFQLGEFRQQLRRLPDAVRVELHDDIAALDHLAGRRHRHPVMRQVAADDGKIGRGEGAYIVADKGHTGALANEVDLELRMEIPDITLPRIVIDAPEKAFIDACDDVLEGRRTGRKRAELRLRHAPAVPRAGEGGQSVLLHCHDIAKGILTANRQPDNRR